ncbi:Retrovirus-related Pol polyprotein from transposon RE1 [Sesamum angolense]|uniref:Retrovirus-related Pol polyprotein from transposon RE1 n=1 Tax=Sesamum angolense TaxID=2727404 RepID=A0AAE1X139_9LAMI|nr:Retrovirus-related Pol polyprotein from transposon RE1 [Sesamum angolense]
MYAASSRNLWLELQRRYGSSNGPMIYQIRRDISSVNQGPNDGSLARFRKRHFLFMSVEKQRSVHTELAENTNHIAYQLVMKENMRDHAEKPVFKRRQYVDKKSLTCVHCHKTGHTKDSCFKLHGVPEWYTSLTDQKKKGAGGGKGFVANVDVKQQSEQGTQLNVAANQSSNMSALVSELLKMVKSANTQPTDPLHVDYANYVEYNKDFAGNISTPNVLDLSYWIIDTGATNHICGDITLFQSYTTPTHNQFIILPDGSKKIVMYTGTIQLSTTIVLDHVLYIPGFSVNLLSVSQLCASNSVSFSFFEKCCILQDQVSKATLAIGHLFKKLYVFKQGLHSTSKSVNCLAGDVSCSVSAGCNSSIWHQRLGHVFAYTLDHIPVIKLKDVSNKIPCDVCHFAKQPRHPFPLSDSHSSSLFDLIHIDLWGPYKEFTISGCNYILSIVDDHSRALWTYLLKDKSQTPYILTSFCNMILTQFGIRIKSIRSDNGSEFLNHHCHSLFQNLGIIHQTTCAYTPQQNGRVERKHRHLLDVARALLFQASLPIKFWGDSILTATFLINRTPTKLLGWKSPFEILYGTPPTYNQLRVFGCLCFSASTTPHKSKFQKRAHKCILIGYAMHKKAYKLFDINLNQVIFSRDVIFYEHIFPYASTATPSSSIPLPIAPNICSDDCVSTSDSSIQPSSSSALDSPAHIPQSSDILATTPLSNTESLHSTHLSPQLLRRSSRIIHRPTRFDDFICHTSTPAILHTHNTAYMSFVATLSILQEPKSFAEAVKYPEWRQAMHEEIQALEHNKTWRMTPLPDGKKAIGCKWVYKLKLKADGNVDRYKARLVAKGYNQIEGIDYTDSFSPVAKVVTVRLFLTIATSHGWPIHQLDVNNAFLHGYLDEDLYMLPPEGYSVEPGMVCKLERSLYGLKQASRQWNEEFTTKLQEFGFMQSSHDYCLFVKTTDSRLLALLVYVDDILLTGSSLEEIQAVKSYLHDLFTIKDIGEARYFLGLEIARNSKGSYVAQTKYILDIVKDTGLLEAKAASTPLPQGLKLTSDCGALLQNPDSYRRLVGRLLYLSFTRPDISHSVQQLSQFLKHPCELHMFVALHVVRYLKGYPSKGLFLPALNSFTLTAYSDADWASCPDSRRSLTGCHAHYRKSVFHERTKHIEIDCHVVRNAYKEGLIDLSYARSSEQLADVFTKVLPLPAFSSLTSKLGLVSLAPSPACGGADEIGSAGAAMFELKNGVTAHRTEDAALENG